MLLTIKNKKMKNDLNNLLAKEMDRSDFLKHIGIALLALTGAASVMKALSGIGGQNVVTHGFGSGSYGGSRATQSRD